MMRMMSSYFSSSYFSSYSGDRYCWRERESTVVGPKDQQNAATDDRTRLLAAKTKLFCPRQKRNYFINWRLNNHIVMGPKCQEVLAAMIEMAAMDSGNDF